jgi:hypothetical protein
MAEVFIAAAPGEETQARGLAEALVQLGFNVAAGAPGENEIAALADDAKSIIVLWSRTAANAPWLTALGVLALDRKKLISIERDSGATPALFQSAPRIDLAARDRATFRVRFVALTAELDKVAATKANA